MTKISTRNINRLWADLLIEELVRAGAGLFCLAPGSRSTPLVTAVAANDRADHIMHFDERGTAFYALGYARATRRPAVWITTSGTAVANGFPAVVEASVDGVPLILLTADRPPELRDTGANQTIDQVKLFGDYVRWQFELPAPDPVVDPALLLTTADQAVYRARRMPSGPVHLNAMFREPLAPDDDGRSYKEYLEALAGWREGTQPYSRYAPQEPLPERSELRALGAALRTVRRGLIVAGRLESAAQADSVRWLSERLGWPLLPDVNSQLRLRAASPNAAAYYDLLLCSEAFRARHVPEAVLSFGSRPTSKRLGQYLADARPGIYGIVRESPSRFDPYHRATRVFEADIVRFCEELIGALDGDTSAEDDWLDAWTSASAAIEERLDDELPATLSEPSAARVVSSLAPEGSALVLASSMPVRDMDTYGSASARGPFVAANRGASGIDGTVATAAGIGHGLHEPVTLLIGDLALLHDLNSLAVLAQSPDPVVLVVLNNHGGGIFSFLPIAQHEDVFESYFGTPHTYDFERAAEMFGLPHAHVADLAELSTAYRSALESGQSSIIEVTTDRKQNVELHRRIEKLASVAVA